MAAPASLSASLPSPGKKHILVLSELRPEDAGEVRFQAGPAQSVAQLEVEGKQLGRDGWEWSSSTPGTGRLAAGPGNAASPRPFLEGLFFWGGSQRAVRFLGRRRLWVRGTEEGAGAIEV